MAGPGAGAAGAAAGAVDPCARWRRDSSQPSGLVNGSSTRRTGGLASTKVSAMAPRIVSTRPSQGYAAVKSGQPSALTVLITKPWNR